MKTCGKCNKEKPIDSFYRNRTTNDGHEARCKECAEASKYIPTLTHTQVRERIVALGLK